MAFNLLISACAAGFCIGAFGINVRKQLAVKEDNLCETSEERCCQWNAPKEKSENFTEVPLVLFSGGCSGSSAAFIIARDIAELSKHPVLDCGGGFELLADLESGFYGQTQTALPDAVRGFAKRAVEANRTLLFKGEDRFFENPQTMETLVQLNSKFAVLKRWNKLDVALCAVQDCFTEGFTPAPFGYKLNETGQKVRDCSFRGRGTNESASSQKIFVDTSHLLENLRHLVTHVNDNNVEFLEQQGVAFQKLSYDDLFSFYSGTPDDLVASSVAWTGFLDAFGIPTTFDTVYEYLKTSRTTFELPKKHSETIANFDTVKKVLENCDKEDCEQLVKMLRE
eukprot:TRINITY_DN388_c0_g1_i1.p1 TRINITY_DN388_c0_g1~~TRINITY_DN388_c0_g1_i1.p1  ORF type:complete len:339 (+),score=60.67 TRINITY_DN388_c0_g1_i1:71-1087(+)